MSTFQDWLYETEPFWTWHWPHQVYLYGFLQRVTTGDCRRLMIFMPPRHGKSELVTVRYSAWRLEREPQMSIIIGSYNQKLANRFSRKIRRISEERKKISIAKDRKAVSEWETKVGGGMRAVGAGAGVTGFGAKLIVIDDPVKNRAEAESSRFRARTWDWFNDDVYTRLEPGGSIILIQTRWHDDDLAGRLIREMNAGGEQWEIVNLPALAEKEELRTAECGVRNESNGKAKTNPHSAIRIPQSSDPLGRLPGEALCPERFDEAALDRIRKQLGSYSFSALYQQRPFPREGALFKRGWFARFVDKIPEGLRWARGYDLAVSTKTSADFTASFRCAYDELGNLFIADGFRGRMEYPEQRRYVVERMLEENNTQHGIESALHGKAFVQDLRRVGAVRHVPFKSVRVEADKFTRALAWANLAEEGRVFLVRGAWNDAFLEEACRFTGKGDAHDDQIDAVSIAVAMLGKKSKALGF